MAVSQLREHFPAIPCVTVLLAASYEGFDSKFLHVLPQVIENCDATVFSSYEDLPRLKPFLASKESMNVLLHGTILFPRMHFYTLYAPERTNILGFVVSYGKAADVPDSALIAKVRDEDAWEDEGIEVFKRRFTPEREDGGVVFHSLYESGSSDEDCTLVMSGLFLCKLLGQICNEEGDTEPVKAMLKEWHGEETGQLMFQECCENTNDLISEYKQYANITDEA